MLTDKDVQVCRLALESLPDMMSCVATSMSIYIRKMLEREDKKDNENNNNNNNTDSEDVVVVVDKSAPAAQQQEQDWTQIVSPAARYVVQHTDTPFAELFMHFQNEPALQRRLIMLADWLVSNVTFPTLTLAQEYCTTTDIRRRYVLNAKHRKRYVDQLVVMEYERWLSLTYQHFLCAVFCSQTRSRQATPLVVWLLDYMDIERMHRVEAQQQMHPEPPLCIDPKEVLMQIVQAAAAEDDENEEGQEDKQHVNWHAVHQFARQFCGAYDTLLEQHVDEEAAAGYASSPNNNNMERRRKEAKCVTL